MSDRLSDRYGRIADQLSELFAKTDDQTARMATAVAVLHHKMPHFFWTGFYRLRGDVLIVGPYQGPLACSVLKSPDGVCWSGINGAASVIVPDVEAFPGHIACDSRSKSEIVVPVFDRDDKIVAILDVDSDQPAAFSDFDRVGLEKIVSMIHNR